MGFYDLSKVERENLVKNIKDKIFTDLKNDKSENILTYFYDSDTYIRKNAYLSLGRIYNEHSEFQKRVLNLLTNLLNHENEKVRQIVVYALGEIGKSDIESIIGLLETAMSDEHHSVRNAVTSALKQMGQKNPKPTLQFAKKFQHHADPNIRKEVIHGIELRGRTHPEDVLPILRDSQREPDKKVQKMIVHVIAQISYKKGCLEKVISELKTWENKDLVEKALKEIIETHKRYEKFSVKTVKEAEKYIQANMNQD